MRILFTGGGTAGHINPALAVAEYVRKKNPDAEILYVGTPGGMEARLVPLAGFEFKSIDVRGFQRKLTGKNIKRNIGAAVRLMSAGKRAKKILDDFKPDIVVGTGGYVTGPILLKASSMGIKTVTHEQNAFPGVTTKLLSKNADMTLLAFEAALSHMNKPRNYAITGNPVREGFISADREAVRRHYGIGDRICILSFGGSLGAKRINEAIADLIAANIDSKQVFLIHATGKFGVDYLPELLTKKGVSLGGKEHIVVREYIDDMARCFAAADLIICRSGALTLSELTAAGRGSILIPSPNVSENHQYHNAMVLANQGAALVIEEKDLSGVRLINEVNKLIVHPERLLEYGKKAKELALPNATHMIYEYILNIYKK